MDKMQMADNATGKTQLDKFKEAARGLEADDDPKRFDERLGKLVRASKSAKSEKRS